MRDVGAGTCNETALQPGDPQPGCPLNLSGTPGNFQSNPESTSPPTGCENISNFVLKINQKID